MLLFTKNAVLIHANTSVIFYNLMKIRETFKIFNYYKNDVLINENVVEKLEQMEEIVENVVEKLEPIEKLENTLNKHTAQIFGKNAQNILEIDKDMVYKDMLRIEKFIYDSLHDLYWQDISKQLEENCFENLCTVIEEVKVCMLSLCPKNQTKSEEIEAFLDVAFLKNVLNVGMAQKQVKCLLKYCFTFLGEYGQPCYDSEID
jgi:tetrahydromethanopterin S-methyltransferase subunit B